MVNRVIKLEGRGLRGESYADTARRSGLFGILPTDTDTQVIEKINADAALSASVAESAAGPSYPDTAAGLAATVDGEAFAVDNGDGTVTVWLNDEGVAVEQRTLATTAALAGDDGASMVGFKQTFAGAVLRSLADWFSDEISVMDFIPLVERVKVRLRTSTADLSAAFQAATDAAASRGGAKVKVPSGTYPNVEGVILKPGVTYDGEGQANTIIKLPSTPTAHMFKADPTEMFDGGGFHGIQLDGGKSVSSAVYNAIDFSECDGLEEYSLNLCFIRGFNRGFNGSLGTNGLGNDRFPTITNSRFWFNKVGVFTNEHAVLNSCDIRSNDIGLSGRINDLHAVYTKFVRNRIGVIGSPGITNSDFTACVWYANAEIGAVLDAGCTVIGGSVAGVNSDTVRGGLGDVGLQLRGNVIGVTGVRIGQSVAATSFGDAAILIDRISQVGEHLFSAAVTGNIFQLRGHGVGIRTELHGGSLYSGLIADNQVSSYGKRFILAGALSGTSINNNVIRMVESIPEGQGVIEWTTATGGTGNSIESNTITGDSSDPNPTGWAIKGGNAVGFSFSDNVFRFFTSPVSVMNGIQAKWRNNMGYVTSNRGTATIPSGSTSVTVDHGLARSPGPGDIMVTPTNSLGAATKYRVSGYTPNTFTIAVDVDPGGSGASFAWQANIV